MPRPTREQFENLVRDHHAAVHRSAARWVGPDAGADVAQDVFVRVLEGKVRLDAARDVRATLCWLATRLGANARRAQRRRDHHEENAMTQKAETVPDPIHAAEAADLRRSLARLVDDLPEDLRLPLQLHCQDQLTFAEVGSALRLSSSAAHERVQRALQRLRTALAARGFAVPLAGLPELVAVVEPEAPRGLEQRLLALGPGAGAAGAAFGARWALGAAAAVATIAVAAYAWPRSGGEPAGHSAVVAAPPLPSAGERPAEVDRPAVTERALAAAAATTEPSPAAVGAAVPPSDSVFLGTVHDAAAWPVAGATVQAVASGGLKPFALGVAATDAQGAFRLEVGPHDLRPHALRLRVVENGDLLLETGDLALPRPAGAEPLALVLPREAGTATSRYEVAVTVVGEDDVPVPDVPVALLAAEGGPPRLDGHAPAASVPTGGDGVAMLRGRRPGAQWLFVDGRRAGRRSHFAPIALERGGSQQVTVVLATGGSLCADVATVEGSRPKHANVWLEDESNGLPHSGRHDGGVVTFAGLGGGTYTLHVSGDHSLSPARRSGLRAGGPPVEVRLKQRDELRDVGDHMAELHGALVDAATGATVWFDDFAIGVRPARDGASTLPSDRAIPLGPVQRMDSQLLHDAFHLAGLTAGRWVLMASVPGYAAAALEFDLHGTEMRTGLRVLLHRGGTVRGRLVDDRGQPVARARVFVVGVGDLADRIAAAWRAWRPDEDAFEPAPSMACAMAWSDAGGNFALDGLPVGVAFRVIGHAGARGTAVGPICVVRDGEVQDGLELALER